MPHTATKVIVYSTPTCPYCDMAKAFLKQNKIAFDEIDVSKDRAAAMEMIKKSGQMGVPVVSIEKDGKEHIVAGFNKEKLRQVLEL